MASPFPIAVAVVAAATLIAGVAEAADPKSLGRFRDWEAFEAAEKGGKVCYALTSPQESSGDYKKRDPAFLMVTRRPAENVYDEVSAIAGYTYQKNSKPSLSIKGKAFVADAVGDVAWPKLNETKRLVAAMKAGAFLKLSGTSSRGTLTRDEFSLRGFTAALKAVAKACPKR